MLLHGELPDIIVAVGLHQYGLSWGHGKVHIHINCGSGWQDLGSAVIPAEVAAIISGYAAHKVAIAKIPDEGWRMIGLGTEERRIA